ncbi:MAG: hypothetical protein HYW45_02495 [Candidatus Daviesbacteria bacterium]|nr:MAG: hypothetical protein HYW45_02495 [Candidatus Daviesbacteria bacterium]
MRERCFAFDKKALLQAFSAASLSILACAQPVSPRDIASDFVQALIQNDDNRASQFLLPEARTDETISTYLSPYGQILAGCQIKEIVIAENLAGNLIGPPVSGGIEFVQPCGDGEQLWGKGTKVLGVGIGLNKTPDNKYYVMASLTTPVIANSLSPTPLSSSSPKSNPETKTVPATETTPLSYHEKCSECGATFTVDKLEPLINQFRVRVKIENTGQSGDLQLVLNNSVVRFFNPTQAQEFRNGYFLAIQQNRVGNLTRELNVATAELYIDKEAGLPKTLKLGESITFWVVSSRSLPNNTAAIQLVLSPIPGLLEGTWASWNENQPFIEIPQK